MPPNEKRVANFQDRMEVCLDTFEEVWLKDFKYLSGDKISVADIFAICELEQPSKWPKH